MVKKKRKTVVIKGIEYQIVNIPAEIESGCCYRQIEFLHKIGDPKDVITCRCPACGELDCDIVGDR